ncbi:MAG: hypothetical protein V1745_03580 [Patescibacteria group bacterium]
MKLPESLRPRVIHPTLLVAADHVAARFFLAGGDTIEQVDAVAMPREKNQDSEGYFRSRDGSRHGDPNADTSDAPRLAAFTKKVAARTTELIKGQDIAHLLLVMPTEVDTLVQDAFPTDVRGTIRHIKNLDLMKEDPLTILTRALERP